MKAMEEEVEEEAEEGEGKDEQQKHEEEEAFKKQCKTSPKKVGKKPSPQKLVEQEGNRSGSEAVEEADKKGATSEAKDKTGEGVKVKEAGVVDQDDILAGLGLTVLESNLDQIRGLTKVERVLSSGTSQHFQVEATAEEDKTFE